MRIHDRETLAEFLYLAFFAFMLSVKMLGFSEGQIIFTIALLTGCALIAIKTILLPFSDREWMVCGACLLLSGIVYLRTGEKGLLLCFLTMLGMKGVSVKKVFIVGAICSGVIIFFKVFTGVFGLLPDKVFVSYRMGTGVELRHTLGYAHPNTLQISAMIFCMMLVYLATKYTGHVVAVSVFSFLFHLYLYQYSRSRMPLLVIGLYLIVNLFLAYRKKLSSAERLLCYVAYPAQKKSRDHAG